LHAVDYASPALCPGLTSNTICAVATAVSRMLRSLSLRPCVIHSRDARGAATTAASSTGAECFTLCAASVMRDPKCACTCCRPSLRIPWTSTAATTRMLMSAGATSPQPCRHFRICLHARQDTKMGKLLLIRLQRSEWAVLLRWHLIWDCAAGLQSVRGLSGLRRSWRVASVDVNSTRCMGRLAVSAWVGPHVVCKLRPPEAGHSCMVTAQGPRRCCCTSSQRPLSLRACLIDDHMHLADQCSRFV